VGGSVGAVAIARYNNDEVLAASIIDLKSYSVEGNVKIEWTALNELNISQYNIERSVDGKNFISIGNIKAQNNGQQKTEYTFTDFHGANGENFYRIMSISNDGEVKYTGIVKVNFVNAFSTIVLSPNPVKDILHIEGLSSSAKTISVFDGKGKLLQQITTSNDNYTFNTRQFSAGVYFVKVVEAYKATTLKFVKQ
jgi:hypothetical protein